MANYVLLYGGRGMETNEAERAKVMEAWGAWFGSLGESLVDGGNPFSGKARTISGDRSVSDGGGGLAVSGYSVVKADSLEQAVEKAKGCPLLGGTAKVMVFETLAM